MFRAKSWCALTYGGAEGDRTPDLRIANAALCQTELLPHEEREYSFKFQDSSFELNPGLRGFLDVPPQISDNLLLECRNQEQLSSRSCLPSFSIPTHRRTRSSLLPQITELT